MDLPPIMRPPDVANALGLRTASAGRRAILAGRAGPYVRDGRRLLVLREAFLAALQARQVTVAPPGPPPVPQAPAWAASLLLQGRNGRAIGARRRRAVNP